MRLRGVACDSTWLTLSTTISAPRKPNSSVQATSAIDEFVRRTICCSSVTVISRMRSDHFPASFPEFINGVELEIGMVAPKTHRLIDASEFPGRAAVLVENDGLIRRQLDVLDRLRRADGSHIFHAAQHWQSGYVRPATPAREKSGPIITRQAVPGTSGIRQMSLSNYKFVFDTVGNRSTLVLSATQSKSARCAGSMANGSPAAYARAGGRVALLIQR